MSKPQSSYNTIQLRRILSAAVLLSTSIFASACLSYGLPSITMTLVADGAPKRASVFVDNEYVAPLGVVQERGIRLPEGRHFVTVEKAGYFPWDQEVIAGSEPISLNVKMTKIPD